MTSERGEGGGRHRDATAPCHNASRMVTIDDVRGALARFRPEPLPRAEGMARAAVAAVFRAGADGAEVLLIHRAEDPADPWSGHMAFPGGRVDPSDDGTLDAAIREAREEVGIDLATRGHLIGRLSDVAAIGRGRPLSLVIEPFVFTVDDAGTLVANYEVADIVWVPLAFLLDRDNRDSLEYQHGGGTIRLPCYRYRHFVIWGLTFAMVDELVDLIDEVSSEE